MNRCFFGCKIKWEGELKFVQFQVYVGAKEWKEETKQVQYGKCIRCGKIYRRKLINQP